MPDDPFDLARFVAAQAESYGAALKELRAGRKTGHWIWFIFPQIAGLGSSAMSRRFAVHGVEEAQAYLDHEVLGPRLIESVDAVLVHAGRLSAESILGPLDSAKLRSSCTLFDHVSRENMPFLGCLQAFFGGNRDPATVSALYELGE